MNRTGYSKAKVGMLFTTLLILLPLQYAWVGIAGVLQSEPWPALVFPGFKNVYSDGERFYVGNYELIAGYGEEERVLSPDDLFPELPLSQLPGFIRTHFRSPERVDELSHVQREWLRQRAAMMVGEPPESLTLRFSRSWFSRPNLSMDADSVQVLFTAEI